VYCVVNITQEASSSYNDFKRLHNLQKCNVKLSLCLTKHYANGLLACNRDSFTVCLVVRVFGYRSGGPGSIPGTTRKKSCGSGTGSTQPRGYN
jgi:hypothetical protein